MFVHYRTQGIIFKVQDRGEADRVFSIYTKDFGRLEIFARAIRKIKSKLRPSTQLFYLSEIEFIQGKIQKKLTDAVLIDNFKNVRQDLEKLKIAYKISDVLDKLIKGPETDEKIWQLLLESFAKLNKESNSERFRIVYYYFLWNLFSILGYQPNLKQFQGTMYKIIKIILAKDLSFWQRIKIKEKYFPELEKISEKYLCFVLAEME